MTRNCHDSTCSIRSENEVSSPDRNALSCQWMNGKTAQRYALLLVEIFDSIELTHVCIDVIHRFPIRFIFRPFDQFFSQRVFGSECDECYTKQRIWPCCKDADCLIRTFDSKFDFNSFRASKPVFLHRSNTVWEIDCFQSIKKFLSILCDVDEPLTHVLLVDRPVTSPTSSSFDLLIRKNGRTRFAPVYWSVFSIGKSRLEEASKEQLIPFVVIRVMTLDHTIPIIRESHSLDLLCNRSHISFGNIMRMTSFSDSCIFCRHSK